MGRSWVAYNSFNQERIKGSPRKMKVIIFMIMTTGNVETIPTTLKEYEFCSDKMMELVTQSNEPLGIFYKGQQIQMHWCQTPDAKYYVSHYDPKWEKNK